MSGFSVERYGYISVPVMIADLIGDMVANGFTIAYSNKTEAIWSGSVMKDSDMYQVILEAGPTVDPLQSTQPWRIQFNVTGYQTCMAVVATPIQLPNTGIVAMQPQPAIGGGSTPPDIIGIIGTEAVNQNPSIDNRLNRFIDRSGGSFAISTPAQSAARPMSYRLSITPHGLVVYVWEEGVAEDGRYCSWVVVQRPVDRDTGVALTTGKCPLFCVYSLFGVINKFVVREVDVLRPSPKASATVDTVDSNWIINNMQQVAISEQNMYVTTFPSRLNTGRYAYTHVLDMICTTSADVVAEWTAVPITVFGESTPRTYTAMTANGNYNTNMRVLVLTQGGGI